ncbi:Uncharacterised protein [Campylobacter hyointestinalis subsp. hyointestinalis]|uniref:Uncharacterized protein n=1 Tax=Campylobacter hyointestinalis subsp. hyointestinalis TaxID=91352 RepID=A0A0S4SVZ2_CAMHY|nr:hypothetical protein [Campylobacter hyointestinalis]CUU89733.1 Uncharacterised protein [Campylobacter hyointestinalis subsp. hyointestinalis]
MATKKEEKIGQLFFDEKGAWIYYPIDSDGTILRKIGQATFSQKGCKCTYKIDGEEYTQVYSSEKEARYEIRVWIRSYMRGEFR